MAFFLHLRIHFHSRGIMVWPFSSVFVCTKKRTKLMIDNFMLFQWTQVSKNRVWQKNWQRIYSLTCAKSIWDSQIVFIKTGCPIHRTSAGIILIELNCFEMRFFSKLKNIFITKMFSPSWKIIVKILSRHRQMNE